MRENIPGLFSTERESLTGFNVPALGGIGNAADSCPLAPICNRRVYQWFNAPIANRRERITQWLLGLFCFGIRLKIRFLTSHFSLLTIMKPQCLLQVGTKASCHGTLAACRLDDVFYFGVVVVRKVEIYDDLTDTARV